MGDELMAKVLAARIAKFRPDKLAEFKALQAEVGFNDRDRLMLDKTINALAQKYPVLTQFGPEILLVIFTAQYGLRQARLFAFVGELAPARAVADKSAKPNGSPLPGPAPAPSAHGAN